MLLENNLIPEKTVVHSKETPNEKNTDFSPEEEYKLLTTKESESPDRNEIIILRGLTQVDKDRLLELGISQKDVDIGAIKRGILLNAGIIFLNKYGDGEKPLINATINDTNLGQFAFLTKKELASVVEFEQASPDQYGTASNNIDDIRKDMIIFMELASQVNESGPYPSRMAAGHFALVWRLKYEIKDGKRNPKLVQKYWNYLINKYKAENDTARLSHDDIITGVCRDFMNEHAEDIYPWAGGEFLRPPAVRGVKVEANIHSGRINVLYGEPSPFLDSGYHFSKNLDITIDHDGKTYRLNSLSLHLFSRGLSELGSGQGSWDQQYITLGEYRKILLPSPETRKQTHDKEEDLINSTRLNDTDYSDNEKERIEKEITQRFIDLAIKTVGKPGDEKISIKNRIRITFGKLKRH